MEKFKAHILVVDDDDGIRELVKEYLSQNNYLVTSSNSAEDALEKVKVIKFDLIVLDIMMPGKSGLEFTKENKDKISTPIILLTAKGEASERIEGLDIGADDYLPKPFEPKELILRINNILNKTKYRNTNRKFKFGKIEIDLNKQFILKNDKSIKINNTEKIILDKMVNSPGKIFKREEIGNLIKIDKERSVDVIITRLRKKIEENPKSPNYLQTIRGEGYVYGLNKYIKNILPKRLFYRGLLIVAVPIVVMQITLTSETNALVIPELVLIQRLSKKTKEIVICITTIGTATISKPL